MTESTPNEDRQSAADTSPDGPPRGSTRWRNLRPWHINWLIGTPIAIVLLWILV